MNLIYRKLENTIAGTVNGKPFNVANTPENLTKLADFQEDAEISMGNVLMWAKDSRKQEVAGSNKYLVHNPLTGEYFLFYEGYRSKVAIPYVLVETIESSFDKGIDFMPVIKAWARLLNNPRYNFELAEFFNTYLNSVFIDSVEYEELLDSGYEHDVAKKLATYQDIAITIEGLLATYKVAELVTWEFIMEWNEDSQEYEKVRNPKYKAIAAKIDPTTGETIEEGSFEKPEFLENYQFTPAIIKNGDKFYSGDKIGYVYEVGKVQKLPKDALRNLRNTFGGGGLYIGGLNYIDTYRHAGTHVLTCFVDPADILSFQSKGSAIRVDALMPNNVWDESVPLSGTYHSSDYGKLSEARLNKLIADAVHNDISIKDEQELISLEREAGRELKLDADE